MDRIDPRFNDQAPDDQLVLGADAAAVAFASPIASPQLTHVELIACECGCGAVFPDRDGIRVEACAGKYFRECGKKRLAAVDMEAVRRI